MKKIKQKILKFQDVNSLDNFLFQICNRLKMRGWQFDKLSTEEKILKWLSRNPEKELVLEIYSGSILKNIKEYNTLLVFQFYRRNVMLLLVSVTF